MERLPKAVTCVNTTTSHSYWERNMPFLLLSSHAKIKALANVEQAKLKMITHDHAYWIVKQKTLIHNRLYKWLTMRRSLLPSISRRVSLTVSGVHALLSKTDLLTSFATDSNISFFTSCGNLWQQSFARAETNSVISCTESWWFQIQSSTHLKGRSTNNVIVFHSLDVVVGFVCSLSSVHKYKLCFWK